MSDFRERLVVLSRDTEATRNFAAFLGEQTAGDARIRVPLRLPVNVFSDRRALIERRVTATLLPVRSIEDASPAYSVVWTSQATQPFPHVTGVLNVEQNSLDDRIVLLVNGNVRPASEQQVDSAGDADSGLNLRIAQAAARDLLRAIAEFIENAAAHNAAARAGHYRRYPATTAVR